MLELRRVVGPTGRLLDEMLRERGLMQGHPKGVVFYGFVGGQPNLPTLNVNAGRVNKYQELVKLDEGGIATVPFSQDRTHLEGTVLGRKFHHTRGSDIVFNPANSHSDFYTELIPKAAEYRVWAFRDKHLATYEKKLDYPERNGRRGRSKEIWNWGNGYAYKFVRGADATLKAIGKRAIEALDLDFGAVDVLLGTDGFFYVLEVNTAPGTQGETRQGITSLVNCIEKWAQDGFPERE